MILLCWLQLSTSAEQQHNVAAGFQESSSLLNL